MIKNLTFLFVILYSIFCCSQEKGKPKTDFVLSSGIILQSNLFADVNIIAGKVAVENSKIPIVGVTGFRIGFESNFRSDENYTIAPKLGYEISATVFSMRLSTVNYFQNDKSEFRLLPEIGFSYLGFINLTYGYGIAFNNGNLRNVSNHRLSLSINLNRKLMNGVKEMN
ncbi:MAG: hypothetical protein KDC81_13780 [Flavobacteriaceae bacterium]|nr:hypothetical protein [Flavobacteriaceae bacterium]